MDPVIRVENISKKYSRNADAHLGYGVSDLFRVILGRRSEVALRTGEFLAVDDVSFHLFPGDTFGLIGRNGSGKTTLLRMMTGLTKPDGGRISIRGRVQALINLGAGFNPKLSGRENIFNSAALMGMNRKETLDVIDEIIDFSDLEDAIDSPIYSYSSGMKARLGFSVAVSLKPEILFIDEILSVGDFAFQNRCFSRMQQIKKQGVTIVLVSHAHNSVIQLCDKALWIHQGRAIQIGPSKETVKAYLEFLEKEEARKVSERNAASRTVVRGSENSGPQDKVSILFDHNFGMDIGSLPGAWHPVGETDVDGDTENLGGEGLLLKPSEGGNLIGLEYFFPDMTTHIGQTLEVSLEAQSEESEKVGINLYYIQDEKTVGHSRNHPGNGAWTHLKHRVTITEDLDPESLRLLVRVREGATRAAIIRNVSARIWSESDTDEGKKHISDPYDGMYGPIHPSSEAIKGIRIQFLSGEKSIERDSLAMHEAIEIKYSFELLKPVMDLNITLKIFRRDGLHLSTISTLNGDLLKDIRCGRISCSCTIHDFDFSPGTYVLVIAVHEGKSYLYRNVVKEFAVTGCGRLTWGIRELKYTYRVDGKTVFDIG